MSAHSYCLRSVCKEVGDPLTQGWIAKTLHAAVYSIYSSIFTFPPNFIKQSRRYKNSFSGIPGITKNLFQVIWDSFKNSSDGKCIIGTLWC